jgi:uncharacterized membrane protein
MTTATMQETAVTQKVRISSIDLMRGIVMVIMALDHSREFFHLGGFFYDATNMQTTTPVLFFTRWITHFCAPTFVFLAGTSIFITSKRKTAGELSLFLLSRGFWLLVIEVVVMRFALFFNFHYDVIVLQVIWAIGASMILMAILVRLPFKILLGIGLLITLTHNLGDGLRLQPGDTFFGIWSLLKQPGFVPLTESTNILSFYPMLPWLGVMILGYCLGKLYTSEFGASARRKLLLQLGLICIALFIVIRFINVYGDPAPWSEQKNALYTFMSFLNCTKYPPSLLYLLMTLGPVLVLLSWMDQKSFSIRNPFVVLGRVPMFFYILHFYILHTVSLLLFMRKTNITLSDIDFHFNKSFGGLTPEAGYSLPWAFIAWISVVLLLYPFCYWYNNYKSTHRHWWLSYL